MSLKLRLTLLSVVFSAVVVAPVVARAQDKPYFITYNDQMEEAGNLEIASNPVWGLPQKAPNFQAMWTEFEYGANAEGPGKAPSLHLIDIQSAPSGALFWAIRNGRLRKGMPGWAHLPDAQIWQIVTYLKTLSEQPQSAAPGNPRLRSGGTSREISIRLPWGKTWLTSAG